jgi:hypothetical protein
MCHKDLTYIIYLLKRKHRILKIRSDTIHRINVGDFIKKVNELPTNLRFVSNNYLVNYIKDSFKETEKYDSFFINTKGKQLEELWGMYGKNPDVDKYVYRITLYTDNM